MQDDAGPTRRHALVGAAALAAAGGTTATSAATDAAAAPRPASLRIRPVGQFMEEYAAYAGQHFTADPTEGETQLTPDLDRPSAVTFPAIDATELAGPYYRPRDAAADARLPAIALCGPISAVKEQVVSLYAERLADAGYACLTFDPRRFGGSGGEPRGYHDPSDVVADFHAAVRALLARDDVDPERVGALGVCMGGGYAVSLGAREKRLGAIVAVGGGYDIGATFQKLQGVDGFAKSLAAINDMIQAEAEGGETQYVPTTAESPDTLAAMPNAEAHSFYQRTSASYAPTWSERFAARSFAPYFAYTSVGQAPLVAPTPMMLIHGTTDVFLLPKYAQATYDAYPDDAGSKELVWIETHNHIELYDQDPYVSIAVEHARRWLDAHLGGGGE